MRDKGSLLKPVNLREAASVIYQKHIKLNRMLGQDLHS